MRVIFLGLFYNPEEVELFLSKSSIGLEEAPNTLQLRILDGLFAQQDVQLTVLNSLPFGTFPKKYRQLFLKTRDWNYKGHPIHDLGYINLPWVKLKMREQELYTSLCSILDKAGGEDTAILAYSLYLPFLRVFRKLSRLYPKVHLSVIVTDLFGEYGLIPANPVKRVLMDLYNTRLTSLYQYPDSFVLLTEAMRDPLQVGDRPWCVVEGIAGDLPAPVSASKSAEQKVILYAGTLQYEFGIRTLLQAFEQIEDPDYALWICGSGEAADEISALSRKDPRIRFFGFVPKAEVNALQRQATVLVNPRQNEGEYVKYSFPSKTFEYLASGVPMIGYKLAGFPDDYDDCIFFVEGNSPEALRDRMVEVCSLSPAERAAFAAHARSFVLENKNCVKQTGKMVNMIKGSFS